MVVPQPTTKLARTSNSIVYYAGALGICPKAFRVLISFFAVYDATGDRTLQLHRLVPVSILQPHVYVSVIPWLGLDAQRCSSWKNFICMPLQKHQSRLHLAYHIAGPSVRPPESLGRLGIQSSSFADFGIVFVDFFFSTIVIGSIHCPGISTYRFFGNVTYLSSRSWHLLSSISTGK